MNESKNNQLSNSSYIPGSNAHYPELLLKGIENQQNSIIQSKLSKKQKRNSLVKNITNSSKNNRDSINNSNKSNKDTVKKYNKPQIKDQIINPRANQKQTEQKLINNTNCNVSYIIKQQNQDPNLKFPSHQKSKYPSDILIENYKQLGDQKLGFHKKSCGNCFEKLPEDNENEELQMFYRQDDNQDQQFSEFRPQYQPPAFSDEDDDNYVSTQVQNQQIQQLNKEKDEKTQELLVKNEEIELKNQQNYQLEQQKQQLENELLEIQQQNLINQQKLKEFQQDAEQKKIIQENLDLKQKETDDLILQKFNIQQKLNQKQEEIDLIIQEKQQIQLNLNQIQQETEKIKQEQQDIQYQNSLLKAQIQEQQQLIQPPKEYNLEHINNVIQLGIQSNMYSELEKQNLQQLKDNEQLIELEKYWEVNEDNILDKEFLQQNKDLLMQILQHFNVLQNNFQSNDDQYQQILNYLTTENLGFHHKKNIENRKILEDKYKKENQEITVKLREMMGMIQYHTGRKENQKSQKSSTQEQNEKDLIELKQNIFSDQQKQIQRLQKKYENVFNLLKNLYNETPESQNKIIMDKYLEYEQNQDCEKQQFIKYNELQKQYTETQIELQQLKDQLNEKEQSNYILNQRQSIMVDPIEHSNLKRKLELINQELEQEKNINRPSAMLNPQEQIQILNRQNQDLLQEKQKFKQDLQTYQNIQQQLKNDFLQLKAQNENDQLTYSRLQQLTQECTSIFEYPQYQFQLDDFCAQVIKSNKNLQDLKQFQNQMEELQNIDLTENMQEAVQDIQFKLLNQYDDLNISEQKKKILNQLFQRKDIDKFSEMKKDYNQLLYKKQEADAKNLNNLDLIQNLEFKIRDYTSFLLQFLIYDSQVPLQNVQKNQQRIEQDHDLATKQIFSNPDQQIRQSEFPNKFLNHNLEKQQSQNENELLYFKSQEIDRLNTVIQNLELENLQLNSQLKNIQSQPEFKLKQEIKQLKQNKKSLSNKIQELKAILKKNNLEAQIPKSNDSSFTTILPSGLDDSDLSHNGQNNENKDIEEYLIMMLMQASCLENNLIEQDQEQQEEDEEYYQEQEQEQEQTNQLQQYQQDSFNNQNNQQYNQNYPQSQDQIHINPNVNQQYQQDIPIYQNQQLEQKIIPYNLKQQQYQKSQAIQQKYSINKKYTQQIVEEGKESEDETSNRQSLQFNNQLNTSLNNINNNNYNNNSNYYVNNSNQKNNTNNNSQQNNTNFDNLVIDQIDNEISNINNKPNSQGSNYQMYNNISHQSRSDSEGFYDNMEFEEYLKKNKMIQQNSSSQEQEDLQSQIQGQQIDFQNQSQEYSQQNQSVSQSQEYQQLQLQNLQQNNDNQEFLDFQKQNQSNYDYEFDMIKQQNNNMINQQNNDQLIHNSNNQNNEQMEMTDFQDDIQNDYQNQQIQQNMQNNDNQSDSDDLNGSQVL